MGDKSYSNFLSCLRFLPPCAITPNKIFKNKREKFSWGGYTEYHLTLFQAVHAKLFRVFHAKLFGVVQAKLFRAVQAKLFQVIQAKLFRAVQAKLFRVVHTNLFRVVQANLQYRVKWCNFNIFYTRKRCN